MTSTGDVEKAGADQPQTEAPPAEKEAKAPKEKKTKSAPKTAAHPPYFDMIEEALLGLKEKSGSSPYAIAKFMEEKHKTVLPANFRKILGLQLKNSAAKGKLIKIKASYKLSEAGKKVTAAVKKPVTQSTPKTTKAKAKPVKKATTTTEAKKKTKKKAKAKAAAAGKPKQPKSIESPAAKRAKIAAAA
ncbi:hypothetical protein ACH5RR_011847 [Cinchona calisaya]|uniref:H15 domain-containing protein n=1 Tax=Cinchona calisaya TaxID=153742 RepID=A0ABD3A620_9GENT